MRKRLTFTGIDVHEGTYSEWEEDAEGNMIGKVEDFTAQGESLGSVTAPATGEEFIKRMQRIIDSTPAYRGLRIIVTEV